MRIAVVGTGGVGGYFGGRLAEAGHEVGFLARPGAHLEALRSTGLHVSSELGDVLVRPAAATDEPADIGPVDVVLLTVKTWQVPDLLPRLAPLVGPGTGVLTLQNGVEAPQQVADVLGREAVLPGTARIFAMIEGPGRIRHVGPTASLSFAEWDGRPSGRVERLLHACHEAGVKATVSRDVWVDLWTKFLFVVPFGTLGAAADAPLGVLRSRPGLRDLLHDAVREIYEVAVASGVALPDDAVGTAMAFLDDLTPEGTTSLHRDLRDGRPSELDAWTGAVVRLGRRSGTATPVHRVLYEVLAARAVRAAEVTG